MPAFLDASQKLMSPDPKARPSVEVLLRNALVQTAPLHFDMCNPSPRCSSGGN